MLGTELIPIPAIVMKKNAELESTVLALQEQLNIYKSDKFGKKSEKTRPSGDDKIVKSTEFQTVSSYKRKKRGRHTKELEINNILKIRKRLAVEDKTCGCCGKLMHSMGEDIAQQLEVIPKLLYLVEYVREKYTCKDCNLIVMGEKPNTPIEKSNAGKSLITESIIEKYEQHLPLYRQSKIWKSLGVSIPDNTILSLSH